MKLISSITMAQAWLEGCQHLLGQPGWVDTTVVLYVAKPAVVRSEDQAVADALDAFLVGHEQFSNHTVAETIFPGYEYVRRGVDGVYNVYPNEIYPRIKDHPEMRRWGAYAYRMLRRRDDTGREYNPLEDCISKMKDKQPKRAAYELGLGFGFDLATYDDDDDRGARMGGPCLSHLSFKFINERIQLTAMYRSHYYMQRAYGNLLGLARLQAFVAEQVGVAQGPLVCHSTMAVLEHGRNWGWSKGEVSPLVAQCEELMRVGAVKQMAVS
jgi:hypothetical protein